MRPCAELVRVADNETDAPELSALNEVLDLEVIRNNPTMDGEVLYWSTGCVRTNNDNPYDDYTKDAYNRFLTAFVKLSLKYPNVVVTERLNLFIRASGITLNTWTYASMSATLFDTQNENPAFAAVSDKGWLAFTPPFTNLRAKFINILEIKKDDGTYINWLRRTIWNAIIPILILIYAWIKLMVKRKWYLWLIASVVLLKLPVIIITEPAAWIMYLLSFYMLGYVYLVYAVLVKIKHREIKSENE